MKKSRCGYRECIRCEAALPEGSLELACCDRCGQEALDFLSDYIPHWNGLRYGVDFRTINVKLVFEDE